jgi:uncharacterized protein VirK/YbjX
MSMRATRDDVVHCYRYILNREPESEAAIEHNFAKGGTLWELVAGFLKSPEFHSLNETTSPYSLHKLSRGDYLARSIKDAAKYRCFLSHYSFLTETFLNSVVQQILYEEVVLYQTRPVDTDYAVTIQTSREIHNEGEVSLYFKASGEPLYVLSFTIVPGDVVKARDLHVILISRMQGWGGKLAAIQAATRSMSDTAPQAILFAALQGVARAVGIDCVAGTRATNHVGYYAPRASLFENAYDDFFLSIGASDNGHGFFVVTVPAREKPMALVKPGHRLRTKVKRALKRDISQSVFKTVLPMLAESRRSYPALVSAAGAAE